MAEADQGVEPVSVAVRVQASARQNEFVGLRAGVLVVRVTAPALDGRANDAVRRMIAKRLGVPRSSVTIARGARSRDKLIKVDGLSEPAVRRGLSP